MIFIQIRSLAGERQVLTATADGHRFVQGVESTRELALKAIAAGHSLEAQAHSAGLGDVVDVAQALAEGRVLPPVDHPDPAHLFLCGTGLTHLGSAEGRDQMHQLAASGQATDSMRMFLEGLEGGKPAAGAIGQQPEWFYKGDGQHLVGTGTPLDQPGYAVDGGEEPEIAGLYIIGADGTPHRLGFCLANEFSDHVTERHNYLWLAHSKLRQAALGPELLTGDLPRDVRGAVRIERGGGDGVGKAVPDRRGQYGAFDRQSGAPSFQICAVPAAGRCARAFLRHLHRQLCRWLRDAGW